MRTKHNLTGLFYLNNNGSRWVIYDNGRLQKVEIETPEGKFVRSALFFESFGNFASVTVSYKSKKYSTLKYRTI